MNNYLEVSLELVGDHVTPEGAWIASSVRNLSDSLEVEVDIMTVLQALHQLCLAKGMPKVAASIEEAFDCAYDTFLENNCIYETDDLCDDELGAHGW